MLGPSIAALPICYMLHKCKEKKVDWQYQSWTTLHSMPKGNQRTLKVTILLEKL